MEQEPSQSRYIACVVQDVYVVGKSVAELQQEGRQRVDLLVISVYLMPDKRARGLHVDVSALVQREFQHLVEPFLGLVGADGRAMEPMVGLVILQFQVIGDGLAIPGGGQYVEARPWDPLPFLYAAALGPEQYVDLQADALQQPLVFPQVALPEGILERYAGEEVDGVRLAFRLVIVLEKRDILVDDGVDHDGMGLEIVGLETGGVHSDDRFSFVGEFLSQRFDVVAHDAAGAAAQDDLQVGIQHAVGVLHDVPKPVDAAEHHFLLGKVGTGCGAAARVAGGAFEKARDHLAAAGAGVQDRHGLGNGDHGLQRSDGAGVTLLLNDTGKVAHAFFAPCKK